MTGLSNRSCETKFSGANADREGNVNFTCSADHVQDWHQPYPVDPCVCVFSSHPFWTSSSLDVPAGVTQEEGHTGFLIHLPSAVRALIFVARRIQPLTVKSNFVY